MIRNGTSISSDFSLDKIIRFSESSPMPRTCMEFTVEGESGLKFYNDLFNRKKMKKFLTEEDPWTYSWWVGCDTLVTYNVHGNIEKLGVA